MTTFDDRVAPLHVSDGGGLDVAGRWFVAVGAVVAIALGM